MGIFICYIDKRRAIVNKYRISEFSLLFICFMGGVYGFYMGMHMFHHKTKKIKFRLLVPIFMIIWGTVIGMVMYL